MVDLTFRCPSIRNTLAVRPLAAVDDIALPAAGGRLCLGGSSQGGGAVDPLLALQCGTEGAFCSIAIAGSSGLDQSGMHSVEKSL